MTTGGLSANIQSFLQGKATPETVWRVTLSMLVILLGVTVGAYWTTAASAVELWATRSTYNHGFLILPISLYLMWEKRAVLAQMVPEPYWPGLIVIFGFCTAWLIANAMGITEGEHFALVGIFQGVILSVIGLQIFRILIFPLMYLWLMVPTGTFLYPLLQTVATKLSVIFLAASGIPIYVDGFHIEVSTGLYHVAEGCAGLNFILASLALAPLYGYLMYTSFKKRVIAIVAMLSVAIIANAIRIFAIIALAEFTDRRIDIVDDHILYGWGFFALILAVMGYFGARFADPEEGHAQTVDRELPSPHDPKPGVIVWLAAILVTISMPAYAVLIQPSTGPVGQIAIALSPEDPTWVESSEMKSALVPHLPGAQGSLNAHYKRAGEQMSLFVGYFLELGGEEDLLGSARFLLDEERWQYLDGTAIIVDTKSGPLPLRLGRYSDGRREIMLAHTYWIDGGFNTDKLSIMLSSAKTKLLAGNNHSAIIAVATPDDAQSEQRIGEFLAALPSLQEELEAVSRADALN